jgi:photosystem II stability/assembly factor-like uncharacterized protein
MLFRSDDDGGNFISLESPYEGSFFGLITNANGNVVVYGLRGNVFHTADEGESWQQVQIPNTVTLSAGTTFDDDTMILINQAGDVLMSQDGGSNFSLSPDSQPMPATGVVQAADGTLVIANLRGLRRVEL